MWAHLRRQGIPVARCTVERLMWANGWQGVRRTTRPRTTVADPGASRAPDLVNRHFGRGAPDELHVADFTYVPLASGFGYTAFVVDAYAGSIVGWACSLHHDTELVLYALCRACTCEYIRDTPFGAGESITLDTGSYIALASVNRCCLGALSPRLARLEMHSTTP